MRPKSYNSDSNPILPSPSTGTDPNLKAFLDTIIKTWPTEVQAHLPLHRARVNGARLASAAIPASANPWATPSSRPPPPKPKTNIPTDGKSAVPLNLTSLTSITSPQKALASSSKTQNLDTNKSPQKPALPFLPSPSNLELLSPKKDLPTPPTPAASAPIPTNPPPTPTVLQPPSTSLPPNRSLPTNGDEPMRSSRSTELERIKELTNDPSVLTFDSEQVQCKKCKKTVKLAGKHYYLKSWYRHRESCQKRPEGTEIPEPEDKSTTAKQRTESIRIKTLEDDPQAGAFDGNLVTCNFCARQIGIGGNHNLGTWTSHKRSCKAPSTPREGSRTRPRTTETERIQELKKDPHVLSFASDHVMCKLCSQRIKLSGPHYLATWYRHRGPCIERTASLVKLEVIDDDKVLFFDPPSNTFNARTHTKDNTITASASTARDDPKSIQPALVPTLSGGRFPNAVAFRPIHEIAASMFSIPYAQLHIYTDNRCPLDGMTPSDRIKKQRTKEPVKASATMVSQASTSTKAGTSSSITAGAHSQTASHPPPLDGNDDVEMEDEVIGRFKDTETIDLTVDDPSPPVPAKSPLASTPRPTTKPTSTSAMQV